jgi:uncharacterized protein (TIGR00255 family)
MIRSMTAYAHRRGQTDGIEFEWEARAVNGRGLDLRLRLPEGVEGLEPAVRSAVAARLARGNVSVTLRLSRPAHEGAFVIQDDQLDRVLDAMVHVQAKALEKGLTIAPASVAEVLAQRGVVASAPATDQEGLLGALLAGLEVLLEDLVAARLSEGRALGAVIGQQLETMARLIDEGAHLADARRQEVRDGLAEALRRVAAEVPQADEERLAQELALIAVRTDVTEEIDRLQVHLASASAMLREDKPVGRRLDFLAQELNREANTLCSKAGSAALTRVGLDLKAAIDQMREQVQNVE